MSFQLAYRQDEGGVAVDEPDETTQSGAPVDSSETGVSDEVAQFVSRILAAAEESASPESWVAARRRLLRHLERNGAQTTTSLCRIIGALPTRARQILAELEEDGLVIRTGSAVERFALTSAGSDALHGTRRVQTQLIARLLGDVAGDDLDRAADVYRTLRTALGHSA